MNQVEVKIALNKHTAVTRSVPEYEVPVLKQLHGDLDSEHEVASDSGVSVVGKSKKLDAPTGEDGKPLSNGEWIGKAYMQLVARYNSKDGAAALKAIYPNEGALARAFNNKAA